MNEDKDTQEATAAVAGSDVREMLKRNPRADNKVFMHGLWLEPDLHRYIVSKPQQSAWMRQAMRLVMRAELRKAGAVGDAGGDADAK